MTSIQQNLKKRLSLTGMSVRDLERRSGLKYSVVQNILYGRSKNPTINVLKPIARELGCSVEDLLSENHVSTSVEENWSWKLYVDVVSLINHIFQDKGLNPSKKQALTCINEIYKYSLDNVDKADQKFAEWIVDSFVLNKSDI